MCCNLCCITIGRFNIVSSRNRVGTGEWLKQIIKGDGCHLEKAGVFYLLLIWYLTLGSYSKLHVLAFI